MFCIFIFDLFLILYLTTKLNFIKKFANLSKLFHLVFAVAIISVSCDLGNDPAKCNDEVLMYYTMLDNQVSSFIQDIYDDDVSFEQLIEEYNKLKKFHKEYLAKLKKIKPIKKDKWFYKSVVEFYETVENVLLHELSDVMYFYSLTWETEDQYTDKINTKINKALDIIIAAEDNVIDSQKTFADEVGLELI